MSKLPPGAQGLIDNCIDLGISLFRLGSTGVKEFSLKANQVASQTAEKIKEVKARYEAERMQAQQEAQKNPQANSSQEKETVGV